MLCHRPLQEGGQKRKRSGKRQGSEAKAQAAAVRPPEALHELVLHFRQHLPSLVLCKPPPSPLLTSLPPRSPSPTSSSEPRRCAGSPRHTEVAPASSDALYTPGHPGVHGHPAPQVGTCPHVTASAPCASRSSAPHSKPLTLFSEASTLSPTSPTHSRWTLDTSAGSSTTACHGKACRTKHCNWHWGNLAIGLPTNQVLCPSPNPRPFTTSRISAPRHPAPETLEEEEAQGAARQAKGLRGHKGVERHRTGEGLAFAWLRLGQSDGLLLCQRRRPHRRLDALHHHLPPPLP